MPKLLDYIKEKGLSHDQVIEILEKSYKPESDNIDSDDSTEAIEQLDLPDSNQVEGNTEIEQESEETEQISMNELDKLIEDKVQKILKIKRKVPSKGTIVKKEDLPKSQEIKKNWYEVLV